MDRAELIMSLEQIKDDIETMDYNISFFIEERKIIPVTEDDFKPFFRNFVEMYITPLRSLEDAVKYVLQSPNVCDNVIGDTFSDIKNKALELVNKRLSPYYKYMEKESASIIVHTIFERIINPINTLTKYNTDKKDRELLRSLVDYKYDSDKVGELIKFLTTGKRGSETACVLIAFIRMGIINPEISCKNVIELELGSIGRDCFSEYITSKRSDKNPSLKDKYDGNMEAEIGRIKSYITSKITDIKS